MSFQNPPYTGYQADSNEYESGYDDETGNDGESTYSGKLLIAIIVCSLLTFIIIWSANTTVEVGKIYIPLGIAFFFSLIFCVISYVRPGDKSLVIKIVKLVSWVISIICYIVAFIMNQSSTNKNDSTQKGPNTAFMWAEIIGILSIIIATTVASIMG